MTVRAFLRTAYPIQYRATGFLTNWLVSESRCALLLANEVLGRQPVRAAGHSHWQNIRHVKEAKDKEKMRTTTVYMRLIACAVRDGGGSRDPKMNSRLASVMEQARANRIPMATIERCLNNEETVDPYIMELRAQGGIFVLVETCAKHVRKERELLQGIAKKYGMKLTDSPIIKEFFTYTGMVLCPKDDSLLHSLDAATELGIELGAEDVEEINSDGDLIYQFQCPAREVGRLKDDLEARGASVMEAEDRYLPNTTVPITKSTHEKLSHMYSRIHNEFNYVQRIFDNIEITETD